MKVVAYSAQLFVGVFVSYILLLVVSSLFVKNKEYDKNSKYYRFLLGSSTAIGLKLVRVRVHYSGLEKLPENSRFLLVSNHRSKFDPIVKWHVLRKYDLAFISKESNFNVPVFGKFIRKCCFMKIDRDNSIKALSTVNKAASLIINDEVSVAVYPEGTRNYETGLLPFHNGILLIASKAKCPVVVASIRGTEKIAKNYPWHHTDVYLDILDVIPEEYVASHRSNDIGEYAREIIGSKLVQEGEMVNEDLYTVQPIKQQ